MFSSIRRRQLDRVLHRERLGDRLDEAVHDHRGRLLLGEAAALEVEELVVADLRDRRLVADAGVLLLDLHVRVRVGARLLVEDQRVATHVALDAVRAFLDPHEAAVGRAAAVLGDRLRVDDRRGLGRGVRHLGARVLVLTGTGVRDRQHLAVRLRAGHHDRRVLHRELRAEVAVDPLDGRFGFGAGALGDEVVDVRRPVLDRRVADARAGLGDQLDDRGVQRVGGVHRRRAALDVVHRRAFVGDDQRALELAGVLRVDAEVRLERHVDVHARRHVDERATRPHRRVQRRELVVAGRDHRAEVLLDELRVARCSAVVHAREEDAPTLSRSSRFLW